jgi:trans-L-3-hydroxyproline dehydratase
MHTGGEPLRIITGGLPEIEGDTILEKRRYFEKNLDHIRRGIILEPRGHADMYGAVFTKPVSEGAHFGILFLHNEGYSTMCGHAILAIARYAFDSGLYVPQGSRPLIIDTPSGVVEADVELDDEEVISSSFLNVPSFLSSKNNLIIVPGLGKVKVDIAFGGAFYAIVDSGQIGISLEPANGSKLKELGMSIKSAVNEQTEIIHPEEEDLGFLYGTIFTGSPKKKGNHSRNVCIFADGELDRSATGTGVCARAALHYDKGEFELNRAYTIESIIGSEMKVMVEEELLFGGIPAIRPRVYGKACYTGRSEYWFDPDDPLNDGFLIR